MGIIPKELRVRLFQLKQAIYSNFTESNWEDVGLITGCSQILHGDSRLLSSLHYGDDDYEGHVVSMIESIVRVDPDNLKIMEDYVEGKFNVQSLVGNGAANGVACNPSVFTLPEGEREKNLIALMMPFTREFDAVSMTIKSACERARMTCKRVDDIWEDSRIMQDIFALIYRSEIVICDFSGRNPNVFYEAGIAHTLGRPVIPLVQHESDCPFDLQAHRYIRYMANEQGLNELGERVLERIKTLKQN